MQTAANNLSKASRWAAAGVIIALAGAAAVVPSYHADGKAAEQDKNAPAASAADQSTSLHDQTDLAITVYNSNIALVRDVRQLQLPSGSFRLKFMDIAATSIPPRCIFVR